MTKKDYIMLAQIINNNSYYYDGGDNGVPRRDIRKENFVLELAAYLKNDNPRFDEKKFIEACGPLDD